MLSFLSKSKSGSQENIRGSSRQILTEKCRDRSSIDSPRHYVYQTHSKTKGLGRIGKNKKGTEIKGLIDHTALALQEDGLPIGILEQKFYARQFLDNLKKQNRHKTPIEEKESYRWLETLNGSLIGVIDPEKFVTIADREADIYEFMLEVKNLETHFLFRTVRDRPINKKSKRSPVDQKMWEFMNDQRPIGFVETEITGKNGKARKANLRIKLGNFILQPPQMRRDDVLKNPQPIKVYAAYVEEVDADIHINEEPVEWMLLTSLETTDLEAALVRVRWYR